MKPEMHGESWLLHDPYRNGSTEGITVKLCGGSTLAGMSETLNLQSFINHSFCIILPDNTHHFLGMTISLDGRYCITHRYSNLP